jgi:ribonuclease HII
VFFLSLKKQFFRALTMRQLELFATTKQRSKTVELEQLAKKRPSTLERQLRKRGIRRFAGVDEVGRGPLAGPVVACACILPEGAIFKGLKDSKLLSEEVIGRLYHELTECPEIDYSVAIVDHQIIDRINILQASLQAMRQAVEGLKNPPEIVVVDGNRIPEKLPMPCLAVVKGDSYCSSVSAASVIAKYLRDQIMRDYDKQWPEYGFASHKGYGTPLHFEKIQQYGPCPIHRKTFSPISELLAPQQLTLFE